MGAVTRATGIGEHTLRAWEKRFGFPKPERLPSGHRRYPEEQVQRLLLVAAALQRGHRAGDVVPLPEARLRELTHDGPVLEAPSTPVKPWISDVLDRARRFDRSGIEDILRRDAATRGLLPFLEDRIVPLIQATGESWSTGDLTIRHEHFLSEVLHDLLRQLRLDVAQGKSRSAVVLATLPRELHTLGLEMVALLITLGGRDAKLLGPQTPVEEIIRAAEALEAPAVGITVTPTTVDEETATQIRALRAGLPAKTRLWLGGDGASLLTGLPGNITRVRDLQDLHRLLQELPA
jgi:methanogenic corrinoid protein MtbC1